MAFKEIIGHSNIINNLKQEIRNNKVSHAYLFYGEEGIGKKKVAIEFIKALNCKNLTKEVEPCDVCEQCNMINKNIHPDVFLIDLAWQANYLQKEITKQRYLSIETARFIKEKISLKKVIGKYNCFIIDDAETFTQEGFNSLLKLLEEPPGESIIILIAKDVETFPETILSRCRLIRFIKSPLLIKDKEYPAQFQEIWDSLIDKKAPLFELLNLKEVIFEDVNREMVLLFVSFLLSKFEGYSKGREHLFYNLIDFLLNLQRDLNYNVNLSIFLDYLLVKLKEIISSELSRS